MLALQPWPGPLKLCLCIPGTGSAGVSSHRGHKWHTSWHRSSGRVSGSDTGSGALGLGLQLNLNYRETGRTSEPGLSDRAISMAKAKTYCSLGSDSHTSSLLSVWPAQGLGPSSTQHQHAAPVFYSHPPPLYVAVHYSPHGYLTRLSLMFLKIPVCLFKKN